MQSDRLLERMQQLHPKVIDLTLDRVWRLLDAMDHPEQTLGPVIHIAGTNGKGSTLAMIEAMAHAAGLSTNAYISPHLVRFHERIRQNGQSISEDELTACLDACAQANGDTPITYFEITTIAAFESFRRQPADLTLLETGLGGRLDATNVLDRPRVTVITPVALDHQQFLGDTLTEIAGEKAGILKPGVPAVVGPQSMAALMVIEARAEKIGAPLYREGVEWQSWEEGGRLVFQDQDGLLDLPLPNLFGAHQIDNAGMAIAAIRASGLGIDEQAMARGITQTNWPARLMPLTNHPLLAQLPDGSELWLDGGHNPAAGEIVADAMTSRQAANPLPLKMVTGMLTTKEPAGYFKPFAPLNPTVRAVPIASEMASFDQADLSDRAIAAGLDAAPADNIAGAVASLVVNDQPVRLLICGSLYLAGDVLKDLPKP